MILLDYTVIKLIMTGAYHFMIVIAVFRVSYK